MFMKSGLWPHGPFKGGVYIKSAPFRAEQRLRGSIYQTATRLRGSPPPELQHLGPAGAKTLNWLLGGKELERERWIEHD